MAGRNEVYKCDLCGNIVGVAHGGDGALVCCGKPMRLFKENSTDAAREKHVPVVEKAANGCKVKVGSVAHPMEEKHYIEWIEVLVGDRVCREYLKPGKAPEAAFCGEPGKGFARAYCNLHGLWRS